MSFSRPNSNLELLFACHDPEISRLICKSMSSIDPENLELMLAKYGYDKALTILWSNIGISTHKEIHPTGFFYAKRYNRPNVIRLYMKLNLADFKLKGSGAKATLHEAAYFGDKNVCSQLYKMASNPILKENLIKSFQQTDVFDDLPLNSAIAGGDPTFTKLAFDLTTTDYDVNELPIRALESRNPHLANIFMDKVVEKFKKNNNDGLGVYMCEMMEIATRLNPDPGMAILNIINGISTSENKFRWLTAFRVNALALDYNEIYMSLVNKCGLAQENQEVCLLSDIAVAKTTRPKLTDARKLIIDAYSNYITQHPNIECTLLKNHLIRLSEEDNTANIESINHLLFDLSKSKAPLEKFKPLIEKYIKYFENTSATAIDYLCATHLACLLGDFKLAKTWYEKCLEKSDNQSPGVIVSTSQLQILQILTMFDELNIEFSREFINTYKNNLFSLINRFTLEFNFPCDAFLHISKLHKKHDSLDALYLAVKKVPNNISPFCDDDLTKKLTRIHLVLRTTTDIHNTIVKLQKQFGVNSKVEPTSESILRANNSLALYQTAVHMLQLSQIMINYLSLPDSLASKIDDINLKIESLRPAIEAAKIAFKELSEMKEKQMLVVQKNVELKSLISAQQALESKKAKQARKLENIEHKKRLEEEERLEKERAKIAEEKAAKELAEKAAREAEEKIKAAQEKAAAERAAKKAEQLKKAAETKMAAEKAAKEAEELQKAIEAKLAAEKAAKEAEELRQATEAKIAAEKVAKEAEASKICVDDTAATQIVPVTSTSIQPYHFTSERLIGQRLVHPIYLYAKQLGYPDIVAELFIKYEGRISLKGGAVRDYDLERKPRDHDFLFFGSFDEISKDYPQAIKKGLSDMPSAKFEQNGCKIDITIRPNGTHKQNGVILIADADNSDLTINSRHITITSTGPKSFDPHNAAQDIRERKLKMPNEKDAIGTYYNDPVRYFRLKDLNDDIHFSLSDKIIENIREIKAHPEQFIASCRKYKKAVSRTINKMIEHYGEARTYSIIKDDEHVLLESGVISNEMMVFLKTKHRESEFLTITRLSMFAPPTDQSRSTTENHQREIIKATM